MKNNRHSILLIVVDQCTADVLPIYGGSICQTPNLDKLAGRGMVFDQAYTSSPICSPARASIYTGLYPHRHGVMTNIYNPGCCIHELPDRPTLLSRQLQQAGYQCGYTGKWHLGFGDKSETSSNPETGFHTKRMEWPQSQLDDHALPTTRGFVGDDFQGHGDGGHGYPQYQEYLKKAGLKFELKENPKPQGDIGYRGEITSPNESTMEYYLVERSKEIISSFDQDEPWHFSLHFWGPHGPCYAPTKFLDQYRNIDIPKHPSFDLGIDNRPLIHGHNRSGASWDQVQEELRYYYALMSYIDHEIGRLLNWLEERDQLNKTKIMFIADHGDSLGRHGGMTDKALSMYEETCRIPMILAGPGVGIGRCSKFTSIVDVYPTTLEWAGIDRSQCERDGQSIVPLLELDEPVDWRDSIVTQCAGKGTVVYTQRMIRKYNWKYVYNVGGLNELYDLDNDPAEMKNLATDPLFQDLLSEMHSALIEWMENHDDREVLNGIKRIDAGILS